ncbi:MAG: NUDIX hydrolase [Anaerolineae bacterium]
MEETVSTEYPFRGRLLNLRIDTVRLSKGRLIEREIVEHPGAVGMVALDDEENVVLVRQFRKAVEGELWEIPAGTREPGEEAEACAQRELREETGYEGGTLRPLVDFYPSPGYCTEKIQVYLVTDLRPGKAEAEEDEVIRVVKVPLAQAVSMIKVGEIRDGKSIVGLLSIWSQKQANNLRLRSRREA